MNTDAVMCMALTSTRPSLTPLLPHRRVDLRRDVLETDAAGNVEGQIFCVRLHMAREYPAHPVVGVGAVVVRDGQALIIKRAHEPRKGEWSLPGGLLELGESLIDAVRRESQGRNQPRRRASGRSSRPSTACIATLTDASAITS